MPQWEASTALWLGLTIPVIALLWVLRPRRPRLRVPSVRLWPGSPAERQSAKPWQRLRNHPLLWLQVAAAALLALAAARPFIPATVTAQRLVVLLDASGSMRARDVSPDRFGAAREAVLGIARGLGPGQEMTVIRVDAQPRALIAGATSAASVQSALDGEQASYGPADVETALTLAAGLTTAPAEWVVVSDGGLSFPEGATRPEGTSFRFVPIGTAAAANVAVSGLAARDGPDGIALQARLRSTGAAPASGLLQLLAEGQPVGEQEWRIEPGGETFVSWGHVPTGPRWFEARLSEVPSEANSLSYDDSAWAAVESSGESTVLLVSAGNTFVERALAVHGGLRSFLAAPADWPQMEASGEVYPLTILDRMWPQKMPAGNALLIGPPTGDEFHPKQVWPREQHPLLSHVDWSEVRVGTARKLPLDSTWETVIDSDGGPLLAVRTDRGRRQAVLAFDLSQSDLALRPAFPILMTNLLSWLLPTPDEAPRAVSPGAAVAVEPAPLAQEMWAESVAGERYDVAPPWPPLPFHPPEPGLYRIVQANESGRQETMVVADGYDPTEADLAPRALDLPASGGQAAPAARGSLSFWPWLAMAVLGISLGEWWLDARGR